MLQHVLKKWIKVGRLNVVTPGGALMRFGQVSPNEPRLDVTVSLRGALTPLKIAFNPYLYLGEAYMDGSLNIEKGTLWDLLELCGRNMPRRGSWQTRFLRLARGMRRRLQQYNSLVASRRNVAHHYDLSDALYRQFLDEDMQYSCAYFPKADFSLDEAQQAKKRHIAAKLLLEPGQHVLDIGCGWGGLALALAKAAKVRVTGITLSTEQLAVARERVHKEGLEHLVTFELKDYREVEGRFDRIVSVGMFEHVGTPNYQMFFDTIRKLLAEDGVALIHSIGRRDGPGVTNKWIRKYIFPGGYVPALSEVVPVVERAGLWLTDLEVLRLHYAETLRHWRQRFLARRSLVGAIYDEKFCRMWEFYLAASEMSFRYDDLMVFQVQVASQIGAVPITRDYMFEKERAEGNVYA